MPNRKINRIMLISPPYTVSKDDVRRCVPPLGLIYIAALLEKNGYTVAVLDAAAEGYYNIKEENEFISYGLDDISIERAIRDFAADAVGVSCIFSSQYRNARHMLQLIKSIDKKIITFTGGSHPTYNLSDALDNEVLDYVVLHEGEYSTLDLLEALNETRGEKDVRVISRVKGIAFRKNKSDYINRDNQFAQDLDKLPLPAWHLLNMESYFKVNLPQSPYPKGKRVAQLVTSRGCIARCVFCTTTNFWGNRYRVRSAENVVEELILLKNKYEIDEIQITDDNFTLQKERALKVIDAMGKLGLLWCMPQGVFIPSLDKEILTKMRDCGCYQLTFAIESGNQEVLNKIIKKPLNLKIVQPLIEESHKLGIKVHGFFVCGFPGETKEQMLETFNFAKSISLDSASFFLATPLIGSELLKVCREHNYLRKDMRENDLLYKIGNISTPDFTPEEAEVLVRQFNRDFNKDDKRQKNFDKEKY